MLRTTRMSFSLSDFQSIYGIADAPNVFIISMKWVHAPRSRLGSFRQQVAISHSYATLAYNRFSFFIVIRCLFSPFRLTRSFCLIGIPFIIQFKFHYNFTLYVHYTAVCSVRRCWSPPSWYVLFRSPIQHEPAGKRASSRRRGRLLSSIFITLNS